MVIFVGAGPGAEDLITVRGQKYLQQADQIIYAGSLVNPALLDMKKETAIVKNSAYMTLEEVIQAICEEEEKGGLTVRAAAALQAEYTLPSISQSVVITRMAGRTPVPERESIRAFAAHGATMVIFLSAGMLPKLQEELLLGGYTEETPAALVYKATWPEEKVCNCTVGTLAKTGADHQISKTALIVVGNVLGESYERSLLYHPEFETEYRRKKGNV